MYVLWIALYGLIFIVIPRLKVNETAAAGVLTAALTLFWVAFFIYIRRKKKHRAYGLCLLHSMNAGEYLLLVPVLAVPIVNVLIYYAGNTGAQANEVSAEAWHAMLNYILYIINLMYMAFGEEIFFRGFLLSRISGKFGAWTGIILSAAVFGMMHIINIFAGASVKYIIMQSVYAAAAGFMFGSVKFFTGSILLPVIIHIAANVIDGILNRDSVGQLENLSAGQTAVLIAAAVLYICYGIILTKIKMQTREEKGEL